MIINKTISEGTFARKQLLSKDPVIAWSHRRRFEIGLELIRSLKPRRLLDYGSGDGTFLALMQDHPWKPELAVGAELYQGKVDECSRRFSGYKSLNFEVISNLGAPAHRCAYDVVVCMEVLEHITDLDSIIRQLETALSPEGHIVISVPVEIGPTILAKQTLRRIAGWRNLGDYKYHGRYKLGEIWRSVFAGDEQHIPRPIYSRDDGATHHDHKGFNWRWLKRRLEQTFLIDRVITSPVPWLGPEFASQVWLIGRKPN
jgi:SAM-dependent methyltransferase